MGPYTPAVMRDLFENPFDTADGSTEEALHRCREALDSIIGISVEAIVCIDEEQRIALFNRGAERVFGYAAAEVIGRPLEILIPTQHRDAHRAHVEEFGRAPEQARPMSATLRIEGRRKGGETFPADISISRGDVAGRMVYSAILRDISQTVQEEETLRQANRDLQALIGAAPLAVIALDLEGRVEVWNPAAERLLGWSGSEVVGKPYPAVPAEKESEFRHELELARRGEPLSGLETERLRRDGSRVAVRVSTAPLLGPSEEPTGLLATVEDITGPRQAEEAQRRLTAILEATPDLVSTADPEGRLLYVNRAGREMLGLAPEEIPGRDIPRGHPPWAASLVMEVGIPTAIRDGAWTGETALLDREGKEFPVSQVILAHHDADGRIEYLSTIIRDISGRKRMEETYRFLAEASRTFSGTLDYQEILEAVPGLIVPRLADYCVIDLLEEDGSVRREVLLHGDPERQPLLERLRDFPPRAGDAYGLSLVLRTERTELVEEITDEWLREVSRSDEHLAVLRALEPRSYLAIPLRARGRLIGALLVVYAESGRTYQERDLPLAEDLAGRAALAIENTRLYRQARDATRTRDEVLRVVAHDLRNPLGAIMLNAGLLREVSIADTDELAIKQIAAIERSAEIGSRLIEDLLDVARMEAGRLAVRSEPLEVEALLREAVELHGMQAGQKDLELDLAVASRLPRVAGDRHRLLQVLGNLIGNAIRFSPVGTRIVLEARPDDAMVRISVTDTGPGIAEEVQDGIFAPFWQGELESRKGTGLGLSIARGLVEAHGGSIGVESGSGRGSTFWFTLPVVREPASAEDVGRPGG
jgi:PAS domain S-box-containing protein